MTQKNYLIRNALESDIPAITAIFNHYVRESFAAYPEKEVDGAIFNSLYRQFRDFGFSVVEEKGSLLGFGFLRPLYPMPNMMNAGEVAYFIAPRHTSKGIGRALLAGLSIRAKQLKMESLVAQVSSENRQSLDFHLKEGFLAVGKIEKAGRKFGKYIDVLWLQKFI
jgi:L-amino acid N-acyltransferase